MTKNDLSKRTPEDLRAKLENLGVEEIDFLIEEEIEDDSPNLVRLTLLYTIWQEMLRKDNTEWFEATIKHFEARQELTDEIVAAKWPANDDYLNSLYAVKASGLDLKHLTAIVRSAQEHLLYQIAYILSLGRSDDEELSDVRWGVFEIDEDGNPLRRMEVLHYYLGHVDPDREEN